MNYQVLESIILQLFVQWVVQLVWWLFLEVELVIKARLKILGVLEDIEMEDGIGLKLHINQIVKNP